MRRSPAAEHLAAPPVGRQQLRTAHNVRKVCSTIPASDRVGFASVAPPPEPREATCECVENKKGRLNGRLSGGGRERLSCLSGFCVRQSARSHPHGFRPFSFTAVDVNEWLSAYAPPVTLYTLLHTPGRRPLERPLAVDGALRRVVDKAPAKC